MLSTTELPEIEQVATFQIHYFGKPALVTKANDGYLYLSLESLCGVFDLDPQTEFVRIQQHTILNKIMAKVANGDTQDNIFLRLNNMATWLLSLPLTALPNANDRDELAHFQQSAAYVLEEAFCEGRLTDEPLLADLLEYDTPFRIAYQEAIMVLGQIKEQLLEAGASDSFRSQYKKI